MHISNRLTASQECQRRLLVPFPWQQMIWKWKEDSVVLIEAFVKKEATAFVFHTLNVLVVSKLTKHVESLLGRFTGPVQNFSRLVGFAVSFVCVPVAFLAASVAVECLDVAGNGRIRGTVAAGTDLSGITLVAEGTSFVVGWRHF